MLIFTEGNIISLLGFDVRVKKMLFVKIVQKNNFVTCRSDIKYLYPWRATTLWAPAFSSALVNTPGPKNNEHSLLVNWLAKNDLNKRDSN